MLLALDRTSRIPLYAQIAEQVRELIARGVLKSGDRLPPNRELAKRLHINRNTVTTAYADLEADGLIQSFIGRGTFISQLAEQKAASFKVAPAPPLSPSLNWEPLLSDGDREYGLSGLLFALKANATYSFAHALPPAEFFPVEEFRKSVDRVLRREGSALLQLGSSSGYQPLLDYLASQLALEGRTSERDQLLITNGCQQSLDLLARVLLSPGDEVIIENPTYPGALSVFANHHIRCSSVPMGTSGMDLTSLEGMLQQRRPKFIYTIPTFHNPTGVTTSLEARRQLLALAVKYSVPLIEDDIYNGLHYDGAPFPSLKALDRHDLVISISSFSKIGFPGLRVGWITAPPIVIERLHIAKQNSDLHASLLTQAAIYEFSRHGLLAKHVRKIKKEYARRRDAMAAALTRYFPSECRWQVPSGGMAIWVETPDRLNASELLIHAMERGVLFSPGEHFYAALPRRNHLRLAFTLEPPALIEEGIKRLGATIKERLSKQRRQPRSSHAPELRALV